MNLDDRIGKLLESNLKQVGLPREDKERIFRDIGAIWEKGTAHNAYFNAMAFLVSKAQRSNENRYFSNNSWAVKSIDIMNAHCSNNNNEVRNIKNAIGEIYTICVDDTGDYVKYFEKAIDTLALYKGKPSIRAIADLIKGETNATMLAANPKLYGSLLDLIAKPEFVECFSRPWYMDKQDLNIYRKLVQDLGIIPFEDGNWQHDEDLLTVLVSEEINGLINSEQVPRLKQLVNTTIRSSSYGSGTLKSYVELVHKYLSLAEGRDKFFYFLASNAVDVIGTQNGLVKSSNAFKVATMEEILAGIDSVGNDDKNETVLHAMAGLISNFPEFCLVRNFVNLTKDYMGHEDCEDVLMMIYNVAEESPDAKHVRKVCDLARYYLNVDGSFVVSKIVRNLIDSNSERNLFGDEDNVGLIETVSDGFMKFKDGINYDLLVKTVDSLSRGINSPRTFGLTLEALALYQDADELIPVCQLVDGDSYDGPRNLKEREVIVVCGIVKNSLGGTGIIRDVAKCLILYHDNEKRGEVLSHLYKVSVLERHLGVRVNTLQHPAIVEEVDKYLDNDELLDLLSHMDDSLENVSSDDLKNLRDSFIARQKDYDSNKLFVSRFYKKFYLKISDQDLANEMSVTEMEQMFKAYDMVDNTCSGWRSRYRLPARGAFFDILNKKVSSGQTTNEKREILREWCYNIPRIIRDNITSLKFTQSYEHPTTQPAKHLSGVSVA